MRRIIFIRAFAFVCSIFFRIIALPFLLLANIMRGVFSFIRKRHQQKKEQRKQRKEQKQLARREHRLKKEQNQLRRQKQREERKRQKEYQKKLREQTRKKFIRKDYSDLIVNLRKKYRDTNLVWVFRAAYAVIIFMVKIYWIAVVVLQKAYWGFHWLFRKTYWGFHWLFRKTYWGFHWLFQKTYWGLHWLFHKAYWGTRWLLQKAYWGSYGLFQKIYWSSRKQMQKVYWNFYYPQSRKLYQSLCKHAYIDLFFVFLREYLKSTPSRISSVRILGVKEYVQRYEPTAQYQVLEAGQMYPVCIPEYFEKEQGKIEFFQSPDIYEAELSAVSLIGGTNVILIKDILLNDAAFYDKNNRIDIRYSAIKNVFNGVAIIEDQEVSETIEKGINLTGAASFNYYHLIIEILSRLVFIDSISKYQDYPILVDEIVLKIPQFQAALECINRLKHPVIRIEKGKKYLVQNLVQSSPTVWMPTNVYHREQIQTSDFMVSPTVLKALREAVGIWQERPAWRNIFISRKNTQAVRLKNEEEVRNLFAEQGFEIVYTEEMTFRQQVECFGQAKCVVGTSGAALTNTIFCQPKTLIGCIIPSDHRFYMYSTIAYLLELTPLFLNAEITEKAPYAAADTFVLDSDYVRRYLQEIKEKYM